MNENYVRDALEWAAGFAWILILVFIIRGCQSEKYQTERYAKCLEVTKEVEKCK